MIKADFDGFWANEASASPDFAEIHPRGVTAIHCCGTLLPLTSNLKGNATMSLPKRPQDLSATALMRVTSFAAANWESPVEVFAGTHVADVDIAAICIA